jgi:hypothetical protein
VAVQFIPAILTAIRAGVPAAKIISKYGKKAYNAVKNDLKKANKEDLKGLGMAGAGMATIAAIEGSGIRKKKKGGIIIAPKSGSAHYTSKKNSKSIAKKYFKGSF